MDLHIKGRTALVCAASKGLGRAVATALAREGVNVTILARGESALQETARAIEAESKVMVTTVIADVGTEAGRAAALAACPSPDILVNNAGGPPAGNFRDFNREAWLSAIEANMLAPIELIRQTVDGMIARKFGRIINITASAMRVPLPIVPLSNGARGGLTAFVSGIAGELIEHNVTINNLLPGPFDTERLRHTLRAAGKRHGRTEEEEYAVRLKEHPARRMGRPDELGATCAFLCSAHASYITGQNILMDGGKYPTTF